MHTKSSKHGTVPFHVMFRGEIWRLKMAFQKSAGSFVWNNILQRILILSTGRIACLLELYFLNV
jgi:hypothetical protein